MFLSKLEYLPNEILYMIFDYLDGFHLVLAFHELNSHFNSLINHIHLHINTTYCRRVDFEYLFNRVFPSINSVFSLTISNENNMCPMEMFMARYVDLIPHNSLRYLKLISIDLEILDIFIITILPKLTELISLNITHSIYKWFDFYKNFNLFHNQLPTLKNISVSVNNYFRNNISPSCNYGHELVSNRIYSTLPTVTHLSLKNYSWDITDLSKLFETLYQIEYLQITIDIDDELRHPNLCLLNSESIRNNGQHLRSLILKIEFSILFSEISSLLNNFPQLKKFSLSTVTYTYDVKFYDAQLWEQLIQTSLPSLISFRLYLISLNFTPIFNANNILEQFRSDFWLNKKQWYFVCDTFPTGKIQFYTIPCPKNVVILLNIDSLAWATTLPSLHLSTFDSVSSLKINIKEIYLNPISLPYFNNIKSINVISFPFNQYHLSKHMNLSKIESVIPRRYD